MTSQTAAQPISADLRRMAPVWALVVVTAIVIVLAMKYISMNFLENAIVANKGGCAYAELYVAAGRKKMESIRTDAAALRFEAESLREPSLGVLQGDEALNKARNDFRRAMELCAVNEEAHEYLAVLEWYDGNAAAAYYHIGAMQRQQERMEDALVSLKLALDQDQNFAPAIVEMVLVHRELGNQDTALEIARAQEEVMAELPEGEIALGRVYLSAGMKNRAEEYLRSGLQDKPTEIPAMSDLFQIFRSNENWIEGGDFFFSLGEGEERPVADSYHRAALLYRRGGALEKEERALQRAIELQPRHAGLSFELAMNLHKQGKMEAASDVLQEAMEKDTDQVLNRIDQAGVRPGSE